MADIQRIYTDKQGQLMKPISGTAVQRISDLMEELELSLLRTIDDETRKDILKKILYLKNDVYASDDPILAYTPQEEDAVREYLLYKKGKINETNK